MYKFRKSFGKFVDAFSYVGMWVAFALVFVVTIDVLLRMFSHFYIPGSNEITEMGMVILIFFGIAALQVKKGHVRVTMVVDKFPFLGRKILEGVVQIFEVITIAIVTYCSWVKTMTMLDKGLGTSILGMPQWPFGLCMTIGMLLYTIMLAIDCIITFYSIKHPEPKEDEEAEEGAPAATM